MLADHVTVGHSVTLHGCRIGSYCLIGMGATILNDAQIGEECIVAAGTLDPGRDEDPAAQPGHGRAREGPPPDHGRGARGPAPRTPQNYFEYKETLPGRAEARVSAHGR